MHFKDLGLSEPLLRAVHEQGYDTPTPIQAQAIPAVLQGGDLLAGAQTGTGKTAGFVLPMLQRLMASPQKKDARGRVAIRALILTPWNSRTNSSPVTSVPSPGKSPPCSLPSVRPVSTPSDTTVCLNQV